MIQICFTEASGTILAQQAIGTFATGNRRQLSLNFCFSFSLLS